MRKIVLAVAALVIVLACNAYAQDQWVEYRSPEMGFAALFPQAPKIASERRQSNDKKITYTQNSFTVDLGTRAFIIMMFDYPAGTLPRNPDEKYWTGRAQDFATGSGTVVRRQNLITLAGRGGVEAVTSNDAQNFYYLLDMTLLGDRLYALVSGGAKGHESSTDAIRFRDSFRLINP